jgi:hypothetical protein
MFSLMLLGEAGRLSSICNMLFFSESLETSMQPTAQIAGRYFSVGVCVCPDAALRELGSGIATMNSLEYD